MLDMFQRRIFMCMFMLIRVSHSRIFFLCYSRTLALHYSRPLALKIRVPLVLKKILPGGAGRTNREFCARPGMWTNGENNKRLLLNNNQSDDKYQI